MSGYFAANRVLTTAKIMTLLGGSAAPADPPFLAFYIKIFLE